MSLFYPTVKLKRVYEITFELLKKHDIKGLMLDVDNTLTTHNNPTPDEKVLKWLEEMRTMGIKLILVSNNRKNRVSEFAAKLNIAYTSNSMKPSGKGFFKASKMLGLKPKELAVVGDQLFTDILGGNLFGCKTILVDLMEEETGPFFKFKRKLETRMLLSYNKKERV